MVHPEVRNSIPHQEVEPSIGGTDVIEDGSGDGETQVTQDNQLSILGLVQRAARVEVVDTAEVAVALSLSTALGLALVVIVTGHVGQEVHGPSEELLENEVGDSGDGSLLHQFVQVVNGLADAGSIFLAGLGDKHHVTGDVTSGLMVLAVGDLPGEVRH